MTKNIRYRNMPTVSTQGRKTVACICPNNKSAGKGIPFDNAHFALFLFDVNDKEARHDLSNGTGFPYASYRTDSIYEKTKNIT